MGTNPKENSTQKPKGLAEDQDLPFRGRNPDAMAPAGMEQPFARGVAGSWITDDLKRRSNASDKPVDDPKPVDAAPGTAPTQVNTDEGVDKNETAATVGIKSML